jgi:hypothetical protein
VDLPLLVEGDRHGCGNLVLAVELEPQVRRGRRLRLGVRYIVATMVSSPSA